MIYKCVLADPPWNEQGGGKSTRGAQRHYPLMKAPAIAELMGEWMDGHVVDPAHLWLWATSNHLKDAMWVMEKLGFRYVTNAVWVKVSSGDGLLPCSTHQEAAQDGLQIGLGQYMRHAHEWLLFGARGKAMVPPPARRPPSVIFAPRTKHSKKPEESFRLIECVSDGPRLEMFARARRDGWDARGNEV